MNRSQWRKKDKSLILVCKATESVKYVSLGSPWARPHFCFFSAFSPLKILHFQTHMNTLNSSQYIPMDTLTNQATTASFTKPITHNVLLFLFNARFKPRHREDGPLHGGIGGRHRNGNPFGSQRDPPTGVHVVRQRWPPQRAVAVLIGDNDGDRGVRRPREQPNLRGGGDLPGLQNLPLHAETQGDQTRNRRHLHPHNGAQRVPGRRV